MRAFLAAAVVAVVARAAIVDRISVRVGTRIITASEVELRVRLAAFQNREKAEMTAARRREAVQQLIDQRLVEREMALGRYPRLDSGKRAELLIAFAAQWFAADVGALGQALISYGIAPAELEEDLARQADLLTFLGLRFRLGEDAKKADADLDAWIRDQRGRTLIEYTEKELGP